MLKSCSGRLFREVEHVAIVVKLNALRIAITGKQAHYPFLLLGREQPFTAVVAIVGAMTAQIVLDLIAQQRIVFLLHLAEERLEAIGTMNQPDLLEKLTMAFAVGRGIDSIAPCHIRGQVQSGLVTQAIVVLWASVAEAITP